MIASIATDEEELFRESTGQMRFSRFSALSSSLVAETTKVEVGMRQEGFIIDSFLSFMKQTQ